MAALYDSARRYDSDNDSEDEAGGVKPLQYAEAIGTDCPESKNLLDDLSTLQWTGMSVRSTSPNSFTDSAYNVAANSGSSSASIFEQEAANKYEKLLEDQEAVLNFSIAHKASATISSILARVNANLNTCSKDIMIKKLNHSSNGQVG
jgi:hypothetical protein